MKQVFAVARSEYGEWTANPRMFILAGGVLFIYVFIVSPMREKILLMNNQPINFFEPYLAVIHSDFTMLLLPVCYLLLMSDFPKIRANTFFLLYRTGRVKWLLGQLLFFVMAAFTFMAVTFSVSIIFTASNSYFYNGWSLVTLNFHLEHPEMAGGFYDSLIPAAVYNHMYPFQDALITTLFLIGYFIIIGLVMAACRIKNKGSIGISLAALIIGLGYATFWTDIPLKWAFPMSNSLIFLHYTGYLSGEKFPLIYSVIYFPTLILLLLITVLILIKKSDFTTEGQI